MALVTIDDYRCKRDGLCAAVCPSGLINAPAGELPTPDPEQDKLCYDCGHCVAVCPTGALKHERLPAHDFQTLHRELLPSPESYLELTRARRSVRAYKPEAVDRDLMERLLGMARHAPTAVHSRQVRFVVTFDAALTRKLAALGGDWLRVTKSRPRYETLMDLGKDSVLRGAPHLIIATGAAGSAWAPADCAIALTHLELGAPTLGLGTCWAGLFVAAYRNHEPLRQALPLPEGEEIQGALMVGRPAMRYRQVPPRKQKETLWL